MTILSKGHDGPINFTKKAQHRVFLGLGWDPKEPASAVESAKELLKGRRLHHDLDLSCYIFDPNKGLIDIIGVKRKNPSDKTDNIYHSGDNVEGVGDGDDEEISVELKNINPDIAHIVFVATVKSGHKFDEVNVPEIRMVDAYSERVFAHTLLGKAEGAGHSGYVFARLYVQKDEWRLHYIDEFFNRRAQKEMPGFVARFID